MEIKVIIPSRGSSPRVRGKPWVFASGARPVRLIPACAGKTIIVRVNRHHTGAHPRVCGENAIEGALGVSGLGSSPRVRGKLSTVADVLGVTGLIPACAGKTNRLRSTLKQPKAHPRVCGENIAGIFNALKALGSSPRVRGKPSMTAERP